MTNATEEITIPDSKLAREIAALVKETETPLLFNHSSRVYFFAAIAGKQRGLKFDADFLYAGAMFHDMGLTKKYRSNDHRFEVDGANAARDFLKGHNVSEQDIKQVWTAIALHTTPGIPEFMDPVIALITAGVEMDSLGINYDAYSADDIKKTIEKHPRPAHFKEEIIQAFYDGIKHKPTTTFGNVNADVLADKDPNFQRINFCDVIRNSKWSG